MLYLAKLQARAEQKREGRYKGAHGPAGAPGGKRVLTVASVARAMQGPPPGPGELLYEYRPLPVHPMGLALLVTFGILALVGLPVALGGGDLALLSWLWFAPFLATLLAVVLCRPGPLRIHRGGIQPSRPWVARALRGEEFLPFSAIRNIYPKPYYVAGAIMSPFAASVGTVEHVGLGLETTDGRTLVLKFTPSLPGFVRGESEGYRLALAHLQEALRSNGRPMVTEVRRYTPGELEAMKLRALRPLMPFPAIVAGFFSPLAAISLGYLIAVNLGLSLSGPALLAIVVLGVVPMMAMILLSWWRSRLRHRLLDEISKFNTSAIGGVAGESPPAPRPQEGAGT